jgi:hypothetical protein
VAGKQQQRNDNPTIEPMIKCEIHAGDVQQCSFLHHSICCKSMLFVLQQYKYTQVTKITTVNKNCFFCRHTDIRIWFLDSRLITQNKVWTDFILRVKLHGTGGLFSSGIWFCVIFQKHEMVSYPAAKIWEYKLYPCFPTFSSVEHFAVYHILKVGRYV